MAREGATIAVGTGERHALTGDQLASGERLDRALAAALDGLSRSRIQTLIAEGRVTDAQTGEPIRSAAHRIKQGQSVAIFIPDAVPAEPRGQKLPLTILHEDADIIVIDKQPGLVVHPAPGNPDRTLVNALIAHCGPSLSGIGGVQRPGIVHRLDKDTSGLMVVAKTQQAHTTLAAQFAARKVGRIYRAVVWGALRPRAGQIEGNIGRDPRNRKKMKVLSSGGKTALTMYEVYCTLGLADSPTFSVVDCRLATGRTHQVRVHLAAMGHPIVGDPTYGGRRSRTRAPAAAINFQRQALDAYGLSFDHPRTQKRISFNKPLSHDIKGLIDCLKAF